ncbi:MAG TPA: DUF1553 domain-containing protein [Fuerstia sp.]|nr:DUF1553 domain-containing protein [Fuerstiella sp.]
MLQPVNALLALSILLSTSAYADTPPEQQQAVDALKGLASNLQMNRDGTVRFVRFSKSIVTDEHVAHIVAFEQLDYLAVVTPTVGDEGLAAVEGLANLDTLYLSDSGVTDLTLSRFSKLQKLEQLYLDRTSVTDEGVSGLAELSTLTTLSLNGTKVSDACLKVISGLNDIEVLSLSDTAITDDGIKFLAEMAALQTLSLNGTTVTSAGLTHLASLSELKTLNLRRTQLVENLPALLARMPALEHLDLRETNLQVADVEQLQKLLPKLVVTFSPSAASSRNALQRYLAGETLKGPAGQTPAVTAAEGSGQDEHVVDAVTRIAEDGGVPDFQRHVMPLLGRLGCNGRTCHGSFQGKGGFNLSMFGFDFDADLTALAKGDEPRVNIAAPEQSLILNKPTSDDDHGGGQRFEHGGLEYQVLKNWIAGGASGVEDKPAKLLRFDVTPKAVVFEQIGESRHLQCVAVWADGRREDVTALTRFQTNDDTVAEVSDDGVITCRSPGDTYVVSFYDKGIFSSQVMMPVSDRTGDRYPAVETPTEVDRLVVQKLAPMGIVPSAICTDQEFLRRVSLDLVGTLPASAEVQTFLADPSPEKRQHKVDELLASEAYTTWWAVKLADLTGSNSQSLGSTDMNSPASLQWNAWLTRRLKDNVGWDKIAAGIILATSRRPGQTYESYAAEQSLHMKKTEGTDFTALDNPMHYYWFRGNNQTDTDRALTFGYTFMGVRLQCAQCHKHPFDQWSKDDFAKFAGFFKRIRPGIAPDAKSQQTHLKTKLGVPIKLDTAALRRQMYMRVSAEGLPIPWNEIWIDPPTDKPWPARILGGEEFELNEFEDPREPLAAWLFHKDNPYFAPAFVNRVWAHYLGIGIVDSPDNFNMANPPTNKALLSWLSDQFITNGFDIKWLHRTIVNSHTYQRSSVTTPTNRADDQNFSHALVRRMPAEVTIDAILRATARDDVAAKYLSDCNGRKIGQHPKSYQARGIDYSLLVFGKPRRTTNCDCERQDQPTLLQSLYVRNDSEMFEWLERSDGWLMSVAKELGQPLSTETKAVQPGPDEKIEAVFADNEKTSQLIGDAYLRTLNRAPTTEELQTSRDHISTTENTVEGLRDLMWALLNTQEFLTNH